MGDGRQVEHAKAFFWGQSESYLLGFAFLYGDFWPCLALLRVLLEMIFLFFF